MSAMGGACLSDDGVYRYHLWRRFADVQTHRGPLGFIMLNPSTADASVDDPTIRRCLGFAEREGCSGINVVNLFAYRATDPKSLSAPSDPIGPQNDNYLQRMLDVAQAFDAPLVAAWGNVTTNRVMRRALEVRFACDRREVPLVCLGTTHNGHPRHPLYVKGDQPLEPFRWAA